MKLVLDTNVVLEMLHWQDPRCAALRAAIDGGAVRCVTDAACLAEFERVLGYPQFERDDAGRQEILQRYCALVAELPGAGGGSADLPRCRDADDQKFVELAARSGADLLVTRDKELLRLARSRRHPPPFCIVTPERALAAIKAMKAMKAMKELPA